MNMGVYSIIKLLKIDILEKALLTLQNAYAMFPEANNLPCKERPMFCLINLQVHMNNTTSTTVEK